MYGFGSRISGMPRRENTVYSGRHGAYQHWRCRLVGNEHAYPDPEDEDSSGYQFNRMPIIYDIELRDSNGNNQVPNAIQTPTKYNGINPNPDHYTASRAGGPDCNLVFRFPRPVVVTAGYIDVFYIWQNWVYECSHNGVDWIFLARELVQDKIDAGNALNRVQILTEFWP